MLGTHNSLAPRKLDWHKHVGLAQERWTVLKNAGLTLPKNAGLALAPERWTGSYTLDGPQERGTDPTTRTLNWPKNAGSKGLQPRRGWQNTLVSYTQLDGKADWEEPSSEESQKCLLLIYLGKVQKRSPISLTSFFIEGLKSD
ncbi:hypothetical protein DdX_19743 [Ditylenchus destructor]|uniref:Uncharacterized protein n=1 Tax=Ditylenchus destructor TaxID=166010 RepID=A0AAD4MHE7_9BILA|nr:hypothetical protein DdX_19743 [Ditylenchus destructor]